jgi:UDP-N-acetylmuramoyl-tripeptide--D-alanyl-D-alanine ligase
MKPLSFSALAAMTGGRLVHGPEARTATRVVTDSRVILPGDVFVALPGEKFDGHTFVAEAARKGAVAAIVQQDVPGDQLPQGFGVIRVQDSLAGLQALATRYRESLGVRVVAVTGSNGKTSTKEFIAAVLGHCGATRKTAGNLNNHIGVPLTLLQIEPTDTWAVVEMGMNHPGELRPLMRMARPEFGVITSAGWAHIEHFADREAIAREKAEVAFGLPREGRAWVQGDNPMLRALAGEISAPVCWVGSGPENDVRVRVERIDASGTRFLIEADGFAGEFFVPVPGAHMAENAAFAVALGLHLGMGEEALREGLAAAALPKGRLALRPWRDGWLLDDTYNANPDSMAAAFRTLMALPGVGRGVALLGSMGELGARSEELHRWVGGEAARAGLAWVLALGPGATWLAQGAREGGAQADIFETHEAMAAAYLEGHQRGDRILAKGSRSQAMERVIALLED